MRERRRKLIKALLIAIGIVSTLGVVGCSKTSEFVIEAGNDREFVEQGQMFEVPENGVFLSDRMFKHYAKGCPDV